MSSRMNNKKAMSTLVAAVSVMLVSLVLAIGLGHALTSAISASLSPSVSCTQLQINSPLTIEKTNYNPETGKIDLTLKRSFDSTVSSFSLTVQSNTGTKHQWTCSSSCEECTILDAGESKTYSFDEEIQGNSILILETNGCVVASTVIER